jgi:transposase
MNRAVVRKAREIYRQRNVVERAINRLKQWRRK